MLDERMVKTPRCGERFFGLFGFVELAFKRLAEPTGWVQPET